MSPIQEYLLGILSPIFRSTPEAAALYEPAGRPARAGERVVLVESSLASNVQVAAPRPLPPPVTNTSRPPSEGATVMRLPRSAARRL